MGGLRADVNSYSTTINACAKNDEWQLGLRLFEQMLAQSVRADASSYTAAISAACTSGVHWQLALRLFGQMLAQNLRADASSYTAAIGACSRGKQWQHALQLFEQSQDLRTTAVTYSAAIS